MTDTFDAKWDELHKAADEVQDVDELIEFLKLLEDIVDKSGQYENRLATTHIAGMWSWLVDRQTSGESALIDEPTWPLIANLALKGVYYD